MTLVAGPRVDESTDCPDRASRVRLRTAGAFFFAFARRRIAFPILAAPYPRFTAIDFLLPERSSPCLSSHRREPLQEHATHSAGARTATARGSRPETLLGSERNASVKGQYHARMACRGWRSRGEASAAVPYAYPSG